MAMSWSDCAFRALKEAAVRQVPYLPDAGLSALIRLVDADPGLCLLPLTTEEEGLGTVTGAWLGGERSALLMQSSGVGNCINALGMIASCRIPLLMVVTMRGEWGEANPWQVPMGQAAGPVLSAMGVRTLRLEREEDAAETFEAASILAFESGLAVAVLIGQRLIGWKRFEE